ncbi:MAG: putative transrane component of transporter [Devosia sp.]|uniref:carbohydrate ABC transporter permease n=1 Tax=Devosia sp. TaxID=1871048 RepID=UPI0026358B0C|nr:sugar ABC transporter permease [Devosia sp.]MDB5540713.1 putative transrane component of transporter [Devosia sp.]
MHETVAASATATDAERSSRVAGERRKLLATRGWRIGDWPAAWLLIAPVLVLFGIAVVYPLVETIRLSFFDIKGLGKPKYVELGNYVRLFADPAFRNTISTTLIFTVATTFVSVSIGWLLAMLCSFAPRQTLPFRVMFFAAFGISEAVAGYMWIGILRPDSAGLLNAAIGLIIPGFSHPWLGDPNTALGALIVAASWGGVGLPLMLCFASVQAIPRTVLEAAYLDGATPTQIMRNIMMPLSLPGVRVAIFINLLGALRAFDIIFILTGGGPVRATETVGYFMYRESMTQFKLGYGAAATVVLLAAVLIISIPAIIQRTAGAR